MGSPGPATGLPSLVSDHSPSASAHPSTSLNPPASQERTEEAEPPSHLPRNKVEGACTSALLSMTPLPPRSHPTNPNTGVPPAAQGNRKARGSGAGRKCRKCWRVRGLSGAAARPLASRPVQAEQGHTGQQDRARPPGGVPCKQRSQRDTDRGGPGQHPTPAHVALCPPLLADLLAPKQGLLPSAGASSLLVPGGRGLGVVLTGAGRMVVSVYEAGSFPREAPRRGLCLALPRVPQATGRDNGLQHLALPPTPSVCFCFLEGGPHFPAATAGTAGLLEHLQGRAPTLSSPKGPVPAGPAPPLDLGAGVSCGAPAPAFSACSARLGAG